EDSDKGSFDPDKSEEALEQAEQELKDKIDAIKQEMNNLIGVSFSSGGAMVDQCQSIRGAEVCFGFAKFKPYLSLIGVAMLVFAYTASLIIVVRR
ncbi:MAG TPA: hypothetical protein VF602_03020, partial [Pedobacter sp.]